MKHCILSVCFCLSLDVFAHTIDIQDLSRLFVLDYMNAKASPFFPLSKKELVDLLVRGTDVYCEDLRTNTAPESVCKAVRNLTDLDHNISFVWCNSARTNRMEEAGTYEAEIFEVRVKACIAIYEKIDWSAPYEHQERKPVLKYKGETYYYGSRQSQEDPVIKAKMLKLWNQYEEDEFRRYVQWLLRDKLKTYQEIIQLRLTDMKQTEPETFSQFSKIIKKNVKSEPLKRKLYEKHPRMPFFFVPFKEEENKKGKP